LAIGTLRSRCMIVVPNAMRTENGKPGWLLMENRAPQTG
jgi:hypothetical protein